MPINANEDRSNCQIPWKRWKKFQGNESLVWLIHISWIKVLTCNLKKYLVSALKVSSSKGTASAFTKHQTSLHDLRLFELEQRIHLICKSIKASTCGNIISGTFHLLTLLNTKTFFPGVPKVKVEEWGGLAFSWSLPQGCTTLRVIRENLRLLTLISPLALLSSIHKIMKTKAQVHQEKWLPFPMYLSSCFH